MLIGGSLLIICRFFFLSIFSVFFNQSHITLLLLLCANVLLLLLLCVCVFSGFEEVWEEEVSLLPE